jgi:plastocyanin
MKKLLVLLIACLALTLAACGSDDDDDDGGSSGGATTTEQTDTGAAPPADEGAAKTVEVDIPSISFDPAEVTVKAGTTVHWTNSDDLPHTVTKSGGPGAEFDSGNLEPGSGEFEQTFDEKGKIDYVCQIHPGQEGSITVE